MQLAQDQPLAEIESMLRSRIGLNPKSLNEGSVVQAVRQRMAALAVEEPAAYVRQLRTDEDEFSELVEQIVVPETWFFRNVEPFRCLRHYVRKQWRPTRGGEAIRVLSVPCCSGEEPYSIAMTLLDCGLLPNQFHVDGVDISRQALRRAAEGVYSERSFREDEAEFAVLRDRYCQTSESGHAVTDPVRSSVRFLHANLVAADFLIGQSPYHVIFCRNLLIYLDDDARRLALRNLKRLLNPARGMLYVGHVEASVLTSGGFEMMTSEFPFAFQPAQATLSPGELPAGRRADKPATRLTRPVGALDSLSHLPTTSQGVGERARPIRSPAPARQRADCPKLSRVRSKATSANQGQSAAQPRCAIDAAQRAADSGRLDEAEAMCSDMLASCPPCADLYCLLGVIQVARSVQGEAERSFQKALYLDPGHRESLVHMMLIAQQAGDERLADNYRRRAEERR